MNKVESSNLSPLRLKQITKINNHGVYSMCLLRDGRLVSGGHDGTVIYKKDSFQSDIIIHDENENEFMVSVCVISVCVLKNGNLTSGDNFHVINIYEIDGNEHKRIHTLKADGGYVYKVIELEDGRLCSCSIEIKIWDKNYQPIQTLQGDDLSVLNGKSFLSIIEMNDYIISSTEYDEKNGVRIWNKHTYQCIKTIPDIYCCNNNSLSKLGENRIILGGLKKLSVLDILSFEYKSFQDDRLGNIDSILVLREDQILIGNEGGEIVCYDSLSNQIVFTQSISNEFTVVSCIIESEDKKIVSSSFAGDIDIYELRID